MAEENTATSSHLNSYLHVYDNGTTARLYVTPWSRSTVADGYWQTVNTIQPLINRDIYLADALDKLANKYTVYSPGKYIDITPNQDGTNTISVLTAELKDNLLSYSFDENYFKCTEVETNSYKVTFNLKEDGFIVADEYGMYCNIDDMLSSTSSLYMYDSLSSNTVSSFTYDYKVATNPIEVLNNLPDQPTDGTIYLIG
jgi:hypothetical protein